MNSTIKIHDAPEAASAKADRRLVTMREVMVMTTFSRPSIYRLLSEGRFPAPLKLGANRIAFVASEIEAWVAARPRVHNVDRRAS